MVIDNTLKREQPTIQKKAKSKLSPSHILYYIVLSLAGIVIIVPLLWMISTSFDKFDSLQLPNPPRLYPENPSFFNYFIVFNNMNMLKYLMNTTIVALMSVVLNLFTASLAGFCFSKGKFPGRNILLILVLSNMMVPFESKLLPIYEIIQSMHLTNTYMGIILPGLMTNAFFIFFIKKFCDDLPNDLYEAGVVDGASKFRIYAQIYIPLMGPVLATIAILDVMGVWNELLWPMVVINNDAMNTVQVGLAIFGTDDTMQALPGVSAAMSTLSVLPLAIIFIFLQKYVVQSVAATGIKQ
jgi:multiple sugar transport system permease protein